MAVLRRGSLLLRRIGSSPPEAAVAAWRSLPAARMATAAAPEQASLEDAFEYKMKPTSLALPPDSKFRYVDPQPGGFRGLMLKVLGFYGNESTRIRGAKRLYARITSQVENPELYSSFGLEKKFRTVHAMLLLHVWMVLVRLRTEEKGSNIGQTMYEVFNLDLEQRIYKEGVKMTMLISKWLKELEKNFYGASVAYDKSLRPSSMKEDLERALWRNVFAEGDIPLPKSGPQLANLQAFARYVRRELACLVITGTTFDFSIRPTVTSLHRLRGLQGRKHILLDRFRGSKMIQVQQSNSTKDLFQAMGGDLRPEAASGHGEGDDKVSFCSCYSFSSTNKGRPCDPKKDDRNLQSLIEDKSKSDPKMKTLSRPEIPIPVPYFQLSSKLLVV